MPELTFLEAVHAESLRQLAPAPPPEEAGPVPVRGGVIEMCTSPEVWTVILTVIKYVAPTVLASVFLKLWDDLMGKKEVDARQVHDKLEAMKSALERLHVLVKEENERSRAEIKRQLDSKNLLELIAQVRKELETNGWTAKKAENGARVVVEAMKIHR